MNAESLLTLKELLDSTDGIHLLGQGSFGFTSVQTDSRKVEKGTLFVPLLGENQDGHKYIPQAIEKGCTVVLICLDNYENNSSFFVELSLKNPEVFFIGVKNTLYGLQNAAGKYVEKFPDLIKIAVTGSSGKTTTKEIAVSILSQRYRVISNEGNLNSETGLPLSVFNIKKEHQVGIFEMGMNRPNEIGEIAAVLKPRFAIVTNIGTAHIGKLGSRENIAREKAKVFDYFNCFGTGFVPKDDDFTSLLSDSIDGKVVYYGEDADDRIKFIEDRGLDGSEFSIDGIKVNLTLPGKYNYRNAIAAIELAFVLGLTSEEIAEGIKAIKPMFGRSQVLKGKYTVVQDCYNANPDSMEKSIDFISSVAASGNKKILILGDMLELGESSKEDHRNVGVQTVSCNADVLIFVGSEMKAAYEYASNNNAENKKIFYYEGKDDLSIKAVSDCVKENALENDIIMIKGSRGMGLERVTALIENT